MLNLFAFFATALSLSCFLPYFFWWQIPLSQVGVVFAHLALLFICFNQRTKIKNILALFLFCAISYFYFSNWIGISNSSSDPENIKISLKNDSSDLSVSLDPAGFSLGTKTLKFATAPINSLNQDFGTVAIGQFEDAKGVVFTLAIIESENLLSGRAWYGNTILMRRLSSLLRQRNEPVVVIFKANVAAGSPLVKQFMYQARLDVKASLNSWKSLVGIKAPLLLGRGVSFSRSEIANSDSDFKFVFRN